MTAFRAAGLMALAVIVAGPAFADDPPVVPAAARARFEAGERLDLTVPGALVAHTAPRGVDGRRSLVLLVRPPAGPAPTPEAPNASEPSPCEPPAAHPVALELWQAALPAADGEPLPPVRLRSDLPGDATDLAARDIDGDGTDELFVLEPDSLWVYDDMGGRTAAVEPQAALDRAVVGIPEAAGRSWRLSEDAPIAAVAVPGAIRFYVPGDGPRWRLDGEFPVVPTATVRAGRIVVSTPGVDWLGRDRDGLAVWAAYVGAPDTWRLRVLLLRPEAKNEARRVQDCWVRFPEPEKPIEVEAHMFDGDPLLVVSSRAADKLSLLGEKRLRVFPLAPDRSHLGHAPLVAVESRMNLWQDATFLARDVEGDGREDLVLGYWKGLFDSKIVLDVYRRQPDGQFLPSPQTTAFNVEDGREESLAFESLFGEGAGDLVVFDKESMIVYPGHPRTLSKKALVAEKSALHVPLPGGAEIESSTTLELGLGGESSLRRLAGPSRATSFVDLDGDGRAEVVLRGQAKGAAIHVIHFDRR